MAQTGYEKALEEYNKRNEKDDGPINPFRVIERARASHPRASGSTPAVAPAPKPKYTHPKLKARAMDRDADRVLKSKKRKR